MTVTVQTCPECGSADLQIGAWNRLNAMLDPQGRPHAGVGEGYAAVVVDGPEGPSGSSWLVCGGCQEHLETADLVPRDLPPMQVRFDLTGQLKVALTVAETLAFERIVHGAEDEQSQYDELWAGVIGRVTASEWAEAVEPGDSWGPELAE